MRCSASAAAAALSILELWQQRDGSETVVTPAEFRRHHYCEVLRKT
jgi:hypothetical protein